ncbi:hypothetical protein MRB53_002297 [Persea americana]|uniref:Uncharacterized protein n=1 Tax=Persea americana TaxID=3435 RepID=A0ACC2MVR1_PERAE|nr:hypothetical protein MRB53_002297 [Persea americana]
MLRSKIKPTGGEAPRDHGTQIGANGSSQNDSNRLPVKFQVNRTSDDRTSKLYIFRTVISTSFDPVSTLGGKSTTESSAFPKNRKLCALICTAFQQVFFRGIKPINEEKFQRKIQERTEAKKPEKRPRNGDRKATEKWTKVQGRRRPWPMVAGDHGPRSPAPWSLETMGAWLPATLEIRFAGFPPKASFFCSFSRFAMFGPCDFLKI